MSSFGALQWDSSKSTGLRVLRHKQERIMMIMIMQCLSVIESSLCARHSGASGAHSPLKNKFLTIPNLKKGILGPGGEPLVKDSLDKCKSCWKPGLSAWIKSMVFSLVIALVWSISGIGNDLQSDLGQVTCPLLFLFIY